MRKTALVILSAALCVLPVAGSAPRAAAEDAGPYPAFVETYENLPCHACGETRLFWVYYEPEYAAGGHSLAEEGVVYAEDTVPAAGEGDLTCTGYHWRWTMCLTCGAINGDLPPDSGGFWQKVFRLEAHDCDAQVTEPTETEGGYTLYTCVCGYCSRGNETPPLPRTGPDSGTDTQPAPDHGGGGEPSSRPEAPAVDHAAYVAGLPGGVFAPDRPVTRAEAAVMLARLLAVEPGGTADHPFSDVPAEVWYAGAVDSLAELGIVRGKGGGRFDPGGAVIRAELAALTVRAFAQDAAGNGNTEYPAFSDVPDGHWAADDIRRAAELGWLRSGGDSLFRPDAVLTRAETVTDLNRILGRSADRAYLDQHPDEVCSFSDMTPDHRAWYDVLEAANGHSACPGEQETWKTLA